jgi:hypothetical protein
MCRCFDLHFAEEAVPTRATFVADFELLESSSEQWAELMRCRTCGQYWKVERGAEADRRTNHAFKLPTADGWQDFDVRPARAELLTRLHGGNSENRCLQAGCQARALSGLVFCVRHANTGYIV